MRKFRLAILIIRTFDYERRMQHYLYAFCILKIADYGRLLRIHVRYLSVYMMYT